MFRAQNPGSKNIFDSGQKQFWFSEQQNFLHISRAAKLGNICISNNVSTTMFPSLARPLNLEISRCHLADYVKEFN